MNLGNIQVRRKLILTVVYKKFCIIQVAVECRAGASKQSALPFSRVSSLDSRKPYFLNICDSNL